MQCKLAVPPVESSKVTPEPQREATADWHCVDFNLASITFYHICKKNGLFVSHHLSRMPENQLGIAKLTSTINKAFTFIYLFVYFRFHNEISHSVTHQ